jgi:DNA uptake protein ComE-like DNA-binding protein
VAGALVRTFDDDDYEKRENDDKELREESEDLIESTRAMFSTLLDGHSTIMQGHTAIESEAFDLNRRQEELKNTAQELQNRIDELQEELKLAQKRAAARECELQEELTAARSKLQQDDADEVALHIEKQLQLASTIQMVLADTEIASSTHVTAMVASLAAARRQCQEQQTHAKVAGERTQKLSKLLEAEKVCHNIHDHNNGSHVANSSTVIS